MYGQPIFVIVTLLPHLSCFIHDELKLDQGCAGSFSDVATNLPIRFRLHALRNPKPCIPAMRCHVSATILERIFFEILYPGKKRLKLSYRVVTQFLNRLIKFKNIMQYVEHRKHLHCIT